MLRRLTRNGISVAEPPPPPFPDLFLKARMSRPKPLQKRILEYLCQGAWPSINAISTDLDLWRFSVQRSLQTMKRDGFVEDQWVYAAPSVLPGIKAHTFHITDRGRRGLKFLQLLGEPPKTYPLGYCILMCLKDAYPATAGQIAKMLSKDRGEVKRTMKSLQNKGLVDCMYSSTRTTFGWPAITHLYRITDLGRHVLGAGPANYLDAVRGHRTPTSRPPISVAPIGRRIRRPRSKRWS